MWIAIALLSAVFYSALWVLARLSRGIPSAVINMAQYLPGPLLLWYFWPVAELPWGHPYWVPFLVLEGLCVPLLLWAMTFASQRIEVSAINPLAALSSVSALFISWLLLHDDISTVGAVGILIVTVGLLLLYRGRWSIWRTPYPWIVLGGVLFFGLTLSVGREVMREFNEPFFLSGLFMTMGLVTTAMPAWQSRAGVVCNRRTLWIIAAMSASMAIQDVSTFAALSLAPAAYVGSIKRLGIIVVSLIGYFCLRERVLPLWQLLLATSIVTLGSVLVTLWG